jgi:photosystem II stability/assembly factor-like uncharacterized protein
MKHLNHSLYTFLTLLFFLGACQSLKTDILSQNTEETERDKATMAKEAMEFEVQRTMDPELGYVPRERLKVSYDEMLSMQGKLGKTALSNLRWKECGPSNVGGRTRAIMWDPNDNSRKAVYAGAVSGGLWYTDNIYAEDPDWQTIDDYFNNMAITTLAHDPNHTDTMYFGTGEGFFNFDAVRGAGIWRSTDGGESWSRLSSTNNSNFHYVQKIIVDASGNVYAGTRRGVWKSTNYGNSWSKVLGGGTGFAGSSNSCGDIELSTNGDLYAAMGLIFTYDGIYKSTNAGTSWSKVYTSGSNEERIEIACAPSANNTIYAVIQRGDTRKALKVMRSTNGANSWTNLSPPIDNVQGDTFTRNQAWYDLILAVDPNDATELYIGGIDLYKSTNSAGSWTQVSHWFGGGGYPEVHADQHAITFLPGSSDTVLFGNDGGVYLSRNATNGTPSFERKEFSYHTTQYYSAAMHPEALKAYYLGGTQDNGSQRIQSGGISQADEVTGGDGGFCHIDEQDPDTQITSYTFNSIRVSTDGFQTFSTNNISSGLFINPSDYDSDNKILYSAAASNQLLRRSGIGGSITATTIGLGGVGQLTAVTVSPNNPTTVYVGNNSGDVYRINNANGAGISLSAIGSSSFPGGGDVSCIAIEPGNEDHILVTFSNYGVNSVWESTDGGNSWSNVEGNLPDMPVRWALFSPIGGDSAMLATELGVWSTDNLNGSSTVWGRPINDGMPSVRVDMLQLRASDSMIIAATHGRGMFSSSVFSERLVPQFATNLQTVYIGEKLSFYDQTHGDATSWQWDFDNNGSIDATGEVVEWAYGSSGFKSVKLIVNHTDTLVKQNFVRVLPNLGTPYSAADGGDFESNSWHFGPRVLDGARNLWERGSPSNHFNTSDYNGSNAWVTDLDGDIVSGDYRCALLTPDFNMQQSGSYTLSFLKSMEIRFCNAPFAVQVQYSIDKGVSWIRLGDENSGTNWYNRGNSTCGSCCIDPSIFEDRTGWTTNTSKQITSYNISSLAGNASVRFRIVLSVAGNYSSAGYERDGFLIDDFSISGPTNDSLSEIEIAEAVKSELLGPLDSAIYYSPDGKLMAKIKNKSNHDFGLTEVEIDAAGIATKNFSTNTDKSRRIMFKTFKVTPTNNDSTADYDIWLYYNHQEVDSWENTTGFSKHLLNIIKSPTDIDAGTLSNTSYGTTPNVATMPNLGVALKASFNNGFSGFGAGRDGNLGPLDVNWLHFHGERQTEKTELYWSTASEINNQMFEIERHLGDTNQIQIIGSVDGAGNSSGILQYAFTDYGSYTFNPKTLFYRIRQTDFDGESSTTPWIALQLQPTNHLDIDLGPNPVSQQMYVQASDGQTLVSYQIIDMNGRTVLEGTGRGWFVVNTSQLPKALYIVELKTEDALYPKVFKIIKE